MKHLKLYEAFQEDEQEVFPSKGKAYHVTPDVYINQIQKEGLTPRTESKLTEHPERIYFYLNPESSFKYLASSLWSASKYKDQVKKYYVLEVDLTQLPDHHFYADPHSMISYIAVYTKQSIPPSAIKVIQTIPVEDLPDISDSPDYEPVLKPQDPQEWDSFGSKWDRIRKMMDELPPDEGMIDLKDIEDLKARPNKD